MTRNTDFDDLLNRYLKGRVSDFEREKIDAWMNVMKSVEQDKKALRHEDEDELFILITNETYQVKDILTFKPAAWQHQRVKNYEVQTVAGIAFVILLLFFAWIIFG